VTVDRNLSTGQNQNAGEALGRAEKDGEREVALAGVRKGATP
jgi:hypothetical protein